MSKVQTAECLVLGELLGLKIVVVVNKVDLLGENAEDKMQKKI
jgi:translation elongation factor EF-1alpha